MSWAVTIVSLIGVVANIKKQRWCFILWIFTNFYWMIVDLRKGIPAQAVLFLIYFLLAIWGLIEWNREEK